MAVHVCGVWGRVMHHVCIVCMFAFGMSVFGMCRCTCVWCIGQYCDPASRTDSPRGKCMMLYDDVIL